MIRRQQGTTLVELIIAVVIIAMAGATIIGLLATLSRNSADAMIQSQSANIANAYLSEILARSFDDPDGVSETGRGNFDDVNDYDGLVDVGAVDRYGNALMNLTDFTVSVVVAPVNLSGVAARYVRVRVTHPLGSPVMLSGFKTDHP